MKKYALLFAVNALILCALSGNAIFTLAGACSPSGQCTDAVGPLTWVMAVLPLVVILVVAILFAPKMLRGLKADRVARSAAKAERAAAAVAAPDVDDAVQSRLRRVARAGDASEPAYTDDDADTEDYADTPMSHNFDSDGGVEVGASDVTPNEAVRDEAPATPEQYLDVDGTTDRGTPDSANVSATTMGMVEASHDGFEEDDAVVDAPVPIHEPVFADSGETDVHADDDDAGFDAIYAVPAAQTMATPPNGPWDWLVSGGQVIQLRPAAQTGFPWAAAVLVEMASAVIEQSESHKLGDFLGEAEAWMTVAGAMTPAEVVAGADAEGFVGWINDVAVHCHLIGSTVTVNTLLMQAMDRVCERAEHDHFLAAALPESVYLAPTESAAWAKAS